MVDWQVDIPEEPLYHICECQCVGVWECVRGVCGNVCVCVCLQACSGRVRTCVGVRELHMFVCIHACPVCRQIQDTEEVSCVMCVSVCLCLISGGAWQRLELLMNAGAELTAALFVILSTRKIHLDELVLRRLFRVVLHSLFLRMNWNLCMII